MSEIFKYIMALGSFFFVVDKAEISRKAVYLTPEGSEIKIGANELLRIRTGHSDKTYVLTILPNIQLLSYKKQIEVKRRFVEIIAGVILEKEIESTLHKDAVKMFVEKFCEYREKSNDDLIILLEQQYSKFFEQPQVILDQKDVEKRLTDKIKSLNKKGKFEEANHLLEKMKKIPQKLYQAHENAENALKQRDFDKAEKEYSNAKKYAEMLEEKALVKMYSAKIHLARKTPSLVKKRDEYLNKALNHLRNDNFTKAQLGFKLAAEVSEELMDSLSAEEYGLKAKVLAEYVNVEKKFKKKK